jgi:hypothetical protein
VAGRHRLVVLEESCDQTDSTSVDRPSLPTVSLIYVVV